MRDGRTKRIHRRADRVEVGRFLERNDVRLVIIAGDGAGHEFRLTGDRHIVGRGPGVDLEIEDATLSRQHAVLEYADGTFRIRDLGSTNGVRVNDRPVQVAELDHGDHVEIGSRVFQYVLEPRVDQPEVYELTSED